MYAWVVPPAMLGRLYQIREKTRVPIARQIRESVQAYLSRVEDPPLADQPPTPNGGTTP